MVSLHGRSRLKGSDQAHTQSQNKKQGARFCWMKLILRKYGLWYSAVDVTYTQESLWRDKTWAKPNQLEYDKMQKKIREKLMLVTQVGVWLPLWPAHALTTCCLGYKSPLGWEFFGVQIIHMIVKIVTPCCIRPSCLSRSLVG